MKLNQSYSISAATGPIVHFQAMMKIQSYGIIGRKTAKAILKLRKRIINKHDIYAMIGRGALLRTRNSMKGAPGWKTAPIMYNIESRSW